MPKKSQKIKALTEFGVIPDDATLPVLNELSPELKLQAYVLRGLGFSAAALAERYSISVRDLFTNLRDFKPPSEPIKDIQEKVLSKISNTLSAGFVTEMKAIDDIYNWAMNRLRLKVQYDDSLSPSVLLEVAKFAKNLLDGNPVDNQARQLFLTLNLTKNEIINLANDQPIQRSNVSGAEGSGTESAPGTSEAAH